MSTLQNRNDSLDAGDPVALICIDDAALQKSIIDQLSTHGFKIHTALFSEEVIVKLRARAYGMVVITETFAGGTAETNCALSAVADIALDQRRQTFVVLIGRNVISRSEMHEFVYGVDLTLRDEDAANLTTVANQCMTNKQEFYATFNRVLKGLRSA